MVGGWDELRGVEVVDEGEGVFDEVGGGSYCQGIVSRVVVWSWGLGEWEVVFIC